jgi:hypothetical protein
MDMVLEAIKSWQTEPPLRILIVTADPVGPHCTRLDPTEVWETPEVFDLRPLSSKRVTAKVRKVEPARFYFAVDDIRFFMRVGLPQDIELPG